MGLSNIGKVAASSVIYTLILVFVIKILSTMMTDYLMTNNKYLAAFTTGILAIVVPILLTLGINYVLRKMLNDTFDSVFMSGWAFAFTLLLVLLVSYFFNDGFGKNGLYTLLIVIGLFFSYKSMEKRRVEHREKVAKEKEKAKLAKKEEKYQKKLDEIHSKLDEKE